MDKDIGWMLVTLFVLLAVRSCINYDDTEDNTNRIELLEQQQANESIMQEYDEDFLNKMAKEPKEE